MRWIVGLLGVMACAWAPVSAAAQGAFASFDKASEPVLNDPHDIEIGPDGQLYIADKFGHQVVVMDADTLEVISTIGDGQLFGAHDVSFGPDGKLYVAVTNMNAVAVFDLSGPEPVREQFLQGFSFTEGALAHSNGRLYVMASGTGQLFAVEGDQIVAGAAGMGGAHDVAEGPDGTVWVADNRAQRLVQFTEDLELIKVLNDPKYGFVGPRYMDIDDLGRVVVADQDAHRVLLIDTLSGDLLGVIGDGSPGIGPGKFDDPEGAEALGDTYYFADSDNNRIVRYVVLQN